MTEQRVWTLQTLAELIDAQCVGAADCLITGLNTLQNASSGELAFLANPAYQKYLSTTKASAVILRSEAAKVYTGNKIISDNPYLSYARLSKIVDSAPQESPGIHPTASVHETASIADDVSIGPNATIAAGVELAEGVVIGAGCCIGADTSIGARSRLNANVTIYHGVTIGSDVILHSGCVIGADGFGFAPSDVGWVKIHQLGGVMIGNRVEIGACTTVDRGALDDTIIADGAIIDNQVQIAHNVNIGENTAIAGCTGIAGSTVIGRNCTIAGAACIAGHLTIADGVHISAVTFVNKSITEPGSYSSGTLATSTAIWRRNAVRFGQLDRIANRLAMVEKVLTRADLKTE